jgi:hypothetical protein
MVVHAIDSELTPSFENDVIVDDDLLLRGHRRRAITRKRVRAPARSNGIANPLLGARKLADANTLLTSGSADAARRSVGNRRIDTCAIWITRIRRALVLVVALFGPGAAGADLKADRRKQSKLQILARQVCDLGDTCIHRTLVRAFARRASHFVYTLRDTLGYRALILNTLRSPRARGVA